MMEGTQQLYGVIDNTLVTLSSIKELDCKKDWLAEQIASQSSESEADTQRGFEIPENDGELTRKNTIKDLANCLNNQNQVMPATLIPLT